MSRRHRSTIEELRLVIDCLPLRTRQAMLEGVRTNDIIVGAYTDREGGVCPMLAAHRCGGRTNFVSFARAWDRFTKAKHARSATPRELRILEAHLEASILADDHVDLQAAIRDHRSLKARRPRTAERVRPGDPDRSKELRRRGGWQWLRPFRRLDDYEAALAMVEAERDRLRTEQAGERELIHN
ncbi:MAG TPA: hypothetical protein VD931_07880 [Baekduia sp.]|nr:hypothetical protein [Baekduia sp.]